jgi:uncharacterized protein (TIGR02246 family)
MKRASVFLIVITSLALPAGAQPEGRAKDRKAIESIALRWQDAWNRHDMKALAALVAEDVDLITVAGTRLRSRKEFEEDHAKSHEGVLRESVLTTKSTEVKFVRPDVAVAHVEWGITGVKGPGGEARPPQRGVLTWVLEKRKGAWLIIASQATIIRE